MNLPIPALPTAHRGELSNTCVNSLLGIKSRTGITMPVEILLHMAFTSGYEAGAVDAGSGELLEEALALRCAL